MVIYLKKKEKKFNLNQVKLYNDSLSLIIQCVLYPISVVLKYNLKILSLLFDYF